MNAAEIEQAISEFTLQPFVAAEFAFGFLAAFSNTAPTLKCLSVELLNENPDWAKEDRRADTNDFMVRLVFASLRKIPTFLNARACSTRLWSITVFCWIRMARRSTQLSIGRLI
jgi:hypothetical protein